MIQIIQKEQEITNMFLEDTAQGDWVIKLGKADFEKVSIGRKPIIAVKAVIRLTLREYIDSVRN